MTDTQNVLKRSEPLLERTLCPCILPTAVSLAIKILDLNASAAVSLRGRKSLGLNRRRTVPLGTRRNNPGTC